jgi:hypothetical protein
MDRGSVDRKTQYYCAAAQARSVRCDETEKDRLRDERGVPASDGR